MVRLVRRRRDPRGGAPPCLLPALPRLGRAAPSPRRRPRRGPPEAPLRAALGKPDEGLARRDLHDESRADSPLRVHSSLMFALLITAAHFATSAFWNAANWSMVMSAPSMPSL